MKLCDIKWVMIGHPYITYYSLYLLLGNDTRKLLIRAAIVKSLEQLFLLGALTEDCKLSDPLGHQMARLPLDPIYSKALIQASQFNCLEEMLITVAMLSVESMFYAPREKLEEVSYELILVRPFILLFF